MTQTLLHHLNNGIEYQVFAKKTGSLVILKKEKTFFTTSYSVNGVKFKSFDNALAVFQSLTGVIVQEGVGQFD